MSPWAPNGFWPIIAAMIGLLQVRHWVYSGPPCRERLERDGLRGHRSKIEGRRPFPEKIRHGSSTRSFGILSFRNRRLSPPPLLGGFLFFIFTIFHVEIVGCKSLAGASFMKNVCTVYSSSQQ